MKLNEMLMDVFFVPMGRLKRLFTKLLEAVKRRKGERPH